MKGFSNSFNYLHLLSGVLTNDKEALRFQFGNHNYCRNPDGVEVLLFANIFLGFWYFEKVYFTKDTYLLIVLCYSINHFTLKLVLWKNDQHKTPIFNISASSILYRRLHRNRKNTILFQPRWLWYLCWGYWPVWCPVLSEPVSGPYLLDVISR